jgi:hypothetical protein
MNAFLTFSWAMDSFAQEIVDELVQQAALYLEKKAAA